MKSWEPGDSEGFKRRIDICADDIDVPRENIWERGLNILEGIEWDNVGLRIVGGSYLLIYKLPDQNQNQRFKAHRTQRMKTWYFLTGTFWWNTLAKRSSPRPLLLVHSGNTTTGREAVRLISSRVPFTEPESVIPKGGTLPEKVIILNKETTWNLCIGIRGTVVDGDCMLAEPVPVRRPGVCLMGVDEWDDVECVGIASGIGKTKIGLNLENIINQVWEWKMKRTL